MALEEKVTVGDVRERTHKILQNNPGKGHLLVLYLIDIRENYGGDSCNENPKFLNYVLKQLSDEKLKLIGLKISG